MYKLETMVRSLGILLALVLAGTAIPTAFSYQEDQKRPAFLGHDKFSFDGFSNSTQFSFGGFSNSTQFPFGGSQNQTNDGQEISYIMHEINYLKKELENTIKEQKNFKFQEQSSTSKQNGTANKTLVPNLGHDIKTDKIYQVARGLHLGH
jgi:hypothetical protein